MRQPRAPGVPLHRRRRDARRGRRMDDLPQLELLREAADGLLQGRVHVYVFLTEGQL